MLLDITLPIELHNRNTGRGGAHWQTTKERKQIEQTLRLLGHERQPFDFPVGITIVRILKKRQRFYDVDSVGRGNAKELIDSLVACGWFHDDSEKWIKACHYMQDERGKKQRQHAQTRIMAWALDGVIRSFGAWDAAATATLITDD